MAADTRREVELIIKANDTSEKTVKSVTAAIKSMSAVIDAQRDSAIKGDASLSDLKNTYRDLENAGKRLLGLDALIDRFRKVSQNVDDARQKADKARQTFEALGHEQAALSSVTAAQDRELTKLAKSADAADRAFVRQEKTLATIARELEQAGVNTSRLAEAEQDLVSAAQEQSQAQNKAGAAIRSFAGDVKALREEQQRMEAQQKRLAEQLAFEQQIEGAARLRRSAEYVKFWTEAIEEADRKEQALADTKLWQQKIADAEKAREAAAYVNWWTEALEKADLEEKQLADNRLWEKKVADAAKARQAAEYVKWWTNALEEGVVQERRFTGDNGAFTAKANEMRKAQKGAKELADEYRRLNTAQEKLSNGARRMPINPFESNGRTTLSLLQRIRGEVLALGAAYIGLQGAISGVNAVINAAKTEQQTMAKLLSVANSDVRAAGDEYKYLREQAERLGVYLPTLAKTYSSFAIAAKAANMNTSEMRFVFERVAEAGRVMNLSNDDMDGIFKALLQMVSKGTVQAEELRGQLGDRLPGALVLAAKGYEGGMREFVKQMELGNVEAIGAVMNLARNLDDAFGEQLEGALGGLAAVEARFQNSLFDFQRIIGNAGITESYQKLLARLTEFFRSEEGRKFAESLGRAFSALVDALIYVIDNLETFQAIAEGLIGLYIAKHLFNMTTQAANFAVSLRDMSKAAENGGVQLTKMQKAFMLLSAAIIGWEIGTVLAAKFEVVRQMGVALVSGLLEGFTKLKYEALIIWEGLAGSWQDTLVTIFNATTKTFRSILEIWEKASRAVGQTAIADGIAKTLATITLEQTKGTKAQIATLRAELETELTRIQDIGYQMFIDASDASKKARAELAKAQGTAGGSATPDPGTGADPTYAGGEDAAQKLLSKYASLLAQIEGVEAQSLKKQRESIEAVTAGLELQYQALFRKINESGVEGAAELERRLRAAVEVLKSEAVERITEEQLKRVESVMQKFAQIETTLGKSSSLGDRLTAIDSSYQALYADIRELDAERAASLTLQLNTMVEQLKTLEAQKYAEDTIRDTQREMSTLIAARNDNIKATTDLVTAGLMSEAEGRERIKTIIADSQPAIEAYAASSREAVEALRGLVSDNVLDAVIAKIDLAATSANRFKVELYSANDANRDLAAGLTGALDESAKGFGEAIAGAQSFGDAIRGAGRAFVDFAAEFLRKIATMILQQIILNALQGSGIGGAISGGVSAAVAHEGGIVGQTTNRSRSVPGYLFANAPRYHGGGVPNLQADEYATILQKNEEVLDADSPRNILNGGSGAGGAAPAPQMNVEVVNTLNVEDMANALGSSKSFTKQVLNVIQLNRTQVKQSVSS